MRYNFQPDPECPEYAEYASSVYDDPMTQHYGCGGDIMEGFTRKHLAKCKRCQEYAAMNVEVV